MNTRKRINGALVLNAAATIIVAHAALGACSSPTPQSGTNTNWACKADSDCITAGKGRTCEQGVCKPAGTPSKVPDSSAYNPRNGSTHDASLGDARTESARDYGGGSIHAVGQALSDGELAPTSVPVPGHLLSVVATDTGWVAVGEKSLEGGTRDLVMTSPDGRHWAMDITADWPGALFDVAFGNGTLVAVGSSGTEGKMLVRPPNGAWQIQTGNTRRQRVLFGNSVFLVANELEPADVSGNGLVWIAAPIEAGWLDFVDGRFIAFNSPAVPINPPSNVPGFRTSGNGTTWTDPFSSAVPIFQLYALARVGDQLLGFAKGLCGDGGPCSGQGPDLQLLGPHLSSISNLVASSSVNDLVPEQVWTGIASNGTRVVATGVYGVFTTTLPVGSAPWTHPLTQFGTPSDIAYAHGRFVVVGGGHTGVSGPSGVKTAFISTSTDGETWTTVQF